MDSNVLVGYSHLFSALSEEMRLRILMYLYSNGEKCVCDIVENFNLGQSNISYHLKVLTDCGFLVKRQVAVWNYYAINREHPLFELLETIFDAAVREGFTCV